METPLQQRIVGAVVLVTLGVIFIPALLDGSGYKSRHARTIEIPPRPVFPPMTQERVEPVATPLDAQLRAQEAGEPLAEPEPAPALQAWMLQVGTFENRANALKYRDELRGKGYTTHIIEEKIKGKANYRVRIGPEVERKRIEALRDKLRQQGVDSYVVAHG